MIDKKLGPTELVTAADHRYLVNPGHTISVLKSEGHPAMLVFSWLSLEYTPTTDESGTTTIKPVNKAYVGAQLTISSAKAVLENLSKAIENAEGK